MVKECNFVTGKVNLLRPKYKLIAFLLMGPFPRALRILSNNLGFAWWAKVKTYEPNTTYWFGPFLPRQSLDSNLSIFVEDLSKEGYGSIEKYLIRCKRLEPLTLYVDRLLDADSVRFK